MARMNRGEGMYIPIVEAWANNPVATHARPVSCIMVNAVQRGLGERSAVPDGVEITIPDVAERLYLSVKEARALISALKRAVKQASNPDPIEGSPYYDLVREWKE